MVEILIQNPSELPFYIKYRHWDLETSKRDDKNSVRNSSCWKGVKISEKIRIISKIIITKVQISTS